MTGMIRQPGIQHASDARLSFEPAGKLIGILFVNRHTRMQRSQATQHEEAIKRGSRHAKRIGPPGQLGCILRRRGNDGTGDHIAVPVQIFGHRVHDEIRA